jgi:cellulose synthase/poly-beta-1,6-N-acetylglucosamine synthase-like glycosyltransferase
MTLANDAKREQSDLLVPALIVFGAIYLAQTGFVGWFLIDWRYISSVIFFLGFELIFIGIAYDITESIFALFSRPRKTPSLPVLKSHPPVAILMTVCDDARPSRWATLYQNYPNCDIFILDDSKTPEQQSLVNQSGHTVVRRPDRHAFKAGNLNYWLNMYGAKYKYAAILDSDSRISCDFLDKLVAFAEHPDNQKIAVFQSHIFPVDAETLFARVLGSMARLRFYVSERFANRAGLVLSWGHNQLIRTDVVRQIGGFCEEISPEDTALSLTLSQVGYSTRLVNVISYDTDPPNILTFTRRAVRWAGQTAEVFSRPWNEASFRLKLLLCYHLYTYTIHNVYIGLLLLTAWGFDSRGISPLKLFQFIGNNFQDLWLWTLAWAEMTLLWVIHFLLRAYLGKRAGISLKVLVTHTLLSTALRSFMGLATDISVFGGLAGRESDFTPTNSRDNGTSKYLLGFSMNVVFWFFVGIAILLGVSMRNRLLFFSLNGLWIVFWAIAPFTLLLFHRDQVVRG